MLEWNERKRIRRTFEKSNDTESDVDTTSGGAATTSEKNKYDFKHGIPKQNAMLACLQ